MFTLYKLGSRFKMYHKLITHQNISNLIVINLYDIFTFASVLHEIQFTNEQGSNKEVLGGIHYHYN